MSGVYVRHMNLPTFNGEEAIRAEIRLVGKQNPQPCLGIMTNASLCCEEWTYYPLQDVPDHGRLIDADALEEKTDDRYSLGEIGRRERGDIVNALRYCAPTIIPADGKGAGE